jgi:outer membrane protein
MKTQVLATAIAALTLSGAALAHEPGNVIVRAGIVQSTPETDSTHSEIYVFGNLSQQTKLKLRYNNDTQIGLSATYIVAPHIGVEFMATTPFSHTAKYKYADGDKGKYGKFKMLPLTLSAQYFFLDPKSRFQPYVGLGLNYTMFSSTKASDPPQLGWGWAFKMKDSWGLAYQAGLDYAITDKLILNASIRKIDIESKGEVKWKAPTYYTGEKFDMTLDPWMYSIGIGYKF